MLTPRSLNRATSASSTPGRSGTGTVAFAKRLTRKTTARGELTGTLFGPYLRDLPSNPYTGLKTVRIDGAAAGSGAAGWRFDSAKRLFQADDPIGAAIAYESALASAGGYLAAGEGSVWVSARGAPLTRIETRANRVAQQFTGDDLGGPIAIAQKALWMIPRADVVWRIDPKFVEALRPN